MTPAARHMVVAALIEADGKILLCRRGAARAWYPGVWELPGGHVRGPERARNALLRELAEELGISAKLSPEPWKTVQNQEAHVSLWRVSEWDGDIRNTETLEHSALAWFAPSDLTPGPANQVLGPLARHLLLAG